MDNDITFSAIESLTGLNENLEPLEERIADANQLRDLHYAFCENGKDASINRAVVQELVDYVPPYDAAELERRGQQERFNVNFGMVSSIINDAVSSYMDIFVNPTSLVKIVLNDDVANDDKSIWVSIMSEEFTSMLRSWDGAIPKMLLLDNLLVTHGVAIPWFADNNNFAFDVASLEDFKFDDHAEAINSSVEACTCEKYLNIVELYQKIENQEPGEDGFASNGWHVENVKDVLSKSAPRNDYDYHWDYEKVQRTIKANRVIGDAELPQVGVVWGFIREMDGTYSVYACQQDHFRNDLLQAPAVKDPKGWLYRRRHAYQSADELFQIFAFNVGNKNNIHTIRALGYFLYEIGQADNVIRSKIFDAVRSRLTETYQPAGGIESQEDMQILDMGPMQIIPPSIRAVPSTISQPLDRTAEAGLAITREIMDRHTGGLASTGSMQNPTSRRNQLEVAADLDNVNKLLAFALNLYYPAYEKLLREIVRRAFTATQTDLYCMQLVKRMKKRCIERGVPQEMFREIDLYATTATRTLGAGSRGARMLMFQQMSQLFAEMDAEGKEQFVFDQAVELVGHDKAVSYFGKPGERRGHIDVSIARLENARLMEGDYIEPTDGENHFVHLQVHIEEGLEPGLANIDEGTVDLGDWVMNNVTLFQHVTETLEVTTVHETLVPELKGMTQRVQQIGEIIENGMRQLNAEQRKREEEGQAAADAEDQQTMLDNEEMIAKERDRELEHQEKLSKMEREAIEAKAKIDMMVRKTEAEIAIKQQESMAKIAAMDMELAAKLRRDKILSKAKTSQS